MTSRMGEMGERVPKIHFAYERITPGRAETLLKNQHRNRSLVPYNWKSYMLDMIDEKWVETHQTIGIAEDGRLLDGANRLKALIEADVCVWLWVAYNVPLTARPYIDVGSPRGILQVMKILGVLDDFVLADKRLLSRITGINKWFGTGEGNDRKLTKREQLAQIALRWEPIQFPLCIARPSGPNVSQSHFLAAFSVAFMHMKNRDEVARLTRCARLFLTGRAEGMLDEYDQMVLSFREDVLVNGAAQVARSAKETGEGRSRGEYHYRTQKLILCYMTQTLRQRIRISRHDYRSYTIPEEYGFEAADLDSVPDFGRDSVMISSSGHKDKRRGR